MKKNSKGFTLAEVLVTIAVIGIIAALTIPAMTNNLSDRETVTKLKSTFSILSQATNMIKIDCGDSFEGCLTDPNAGDNDTTARSEVYNLYKERILGAKNCGTASGCFADETYKHLHGGDWENLDSWSASDTFILANGASVAIDWNGPGFASAIMYFFIDLNNKSGPNQFGKDTFVFYYSKNKRIIEPFYSVGATTACDASGNGWSCAAKILAENGVNY